MYKRQLYVRPVDGEIVKPWSDGELVFSETLGDYRVHNGIDIAASVGTKMCIRDRAGRSARQ